MDKLVASEGYQTADRHVPCTFLPPMQNSDFPDEQPRIGRLFVKTPGSADIVHRAGQSLEKRLHRILSREAARRTAWPAELNGFIQTPLMSSSMDGCSSAMPMSNRAFLEIQVDRRL